MFFGENYSCSDIIKWGKKDKLHHGDWSMAVPTNSSIRNVNCHDIKMTVILKTMYLMLINPEFHLWATTFFEEFLNVLKFFRFKKHCLKYKQKAKYITW